MLVPTWTLQGSVQTEELVLSTPCTPGAGGFEWYLGLAWQSCNKSENQATSLGQSSSPASRSWRETPRDTILWLSHGLPRESISWCSLPHKVNIPQIIKVQLGESQLPKDPRNKHKRQDLHFLTHRFSLWILFNCIRYSYTSLISTIKGFY